MTISSSEQSAALLKPSKPVGIVGYGAYVPRYRLPAKEVARVWTGGKASLPIKEKAVPGLDEDVATMSIEAARNAMKRAGIDAQSLRAVWVGSNRTRTRSNPPPHWWLRRSEQCPTLRLQIGSLLARREPRLS